MAQGPVLGDVSGKRWLSRDTTLAATVGGTWSHDYTRNDGYRQKTFVLYGEETIVHKRFA